MIYLTTCDLEQSKLFYIRAFHTFFQCAKEPLNYKETLKHLTNEFDWLIQLSSTFKSRIRKKPVQGFEKIYDQYIVPVIDQ